MQYCHSNTTQTDIVVKPSELRDIRRTIVDKLNQKIATECTEKNGYVMRITAIDPRYTNIISRISGNCIVQVTFTTDNLRPCVDHIYSVKITKVYKTGIVASFTKITFFIPTTTLENYEFKENRFESPTDVIEEGQTVKVRVTAVRYENGNFQCMSTLFKKELVEEKNESTDCK
jgi:DNA-directed RNA polymerase subunit E'/Rpb7